MRILPRTVCSPDAQAPDSGTVITGLGSALMLVSLIFLELLTLKANRIVTGVPYSGLQLWGPALFLPAAGLGLLSMLRCRARDVKLLLTGAWATLGAAAAGLGAVGHQAAALAPLGGAYGRVSPGPGVWLLLLGAYLSLKGWETGLPPRQRRFSSPLLPLMVIGLLVTGAFRSLSPLQEYAQRQEVFTAALLSHLLLAVGSVLAGGASGFLWGLWIDSHPRGEAGSFLLINLTQTIPTLALLGLLMVPLGLLAGVSPWLRELGIGAIGWAPAFIALSLYALLPVAANTVSGLRATDPEAVAAARGMGMSPGEILRMVRLPLALPVVLAGFRTALTQSMGNTVLAGLIGGGGMGSMIFLGLAQSAPDLILLGTLPVVALALLSDALMEAAVGLASIPKGGTASDRI